MLYFKMPVSAGTPLRQLGVWEEIFWRYSRSGPRGFCYAVEVEGSTTVGRWRAALDRLQRSQPLFSAYVEDVPGIAPAFWSVADVPIPMRVRVLGDTRWEDEVEREIGTPFRDDDRPLLRTVLLHGPDRAMLVVTAHYAISDGASMAPALLDLVRLLNGEQIEDHPVPASIEELLAVSREFPAVPVAFPLAEPPAPAPHDAARPVVSSLKLSDSLTTAMLQAARWHGTTVHGMLGAAVVRVGRRANPDWAARPVRLLSPADPRRHLGIRGASALYFQAVVSTVEARPAFGFWFEARVLSGNVGRMITRENFVGTARAMTAAIRSGLDDDGALAFMRHGLPHDAIVSNLGRVDPEPRSERIRLASLWGSSTLTAMPDEQFIGVTTVNGCLHMLYTSRAPMPAFLPRVADELEREVRAA